MAPVRRNPCFRPEPDDTWCSGRPVQSKPIPTDPGDRSIAGKPVVDMLEQPPICEKLLLPMKKKRATSESDAFSDDQSSADDSFAIPLKKRRVESGSDGTSGAAYGTPLQTHHRQYDHDTMTPECARAASPKSTSSSAITAITCQQLPQKKLMHNGIRSGSGVLSDHRRLLLHATPSHGHGLERAEKSAAGAARAKKKTNRSRDKMPRRDAAVTFFRTRPLRLSEGLREHLAELGVGDGDTAPQFVCMKALGKSDVEKNQNRLLLSCKRESFEGHPISALFAGIPRETYYVHEHGPGLLVSAMDGRGTLFKVKLRYLSSNFAYRLIGGWGTFVRGNELFAAFQQGRRVEVELWSFRSRLLPGQPVLEDEVERKVVEGLEGHPEGALGLLFLPYVDGHPAWEPYVDGHPAGEEREVDGGRSQEERAPPVHETKRRASAKVVHGTKKQQTPANVVPAESKLQDHRLSTNRGKAVVPEMTFNDIVRAWGQEIAYACVGLLKLANTRFV